MFSIKLASIALLAQLVTLATARKCMNITVPVTISARTGIFGNVNVPVGDLDPTTFILNATRQGILSYQLQSDLLIHSRMHVDYG